MMFDVDTYPYNSYRPKAMKIVVLSLILLGCAATNSGYSPADLSAAIVQTEASYFVIRLKNQGHDEVNMNINWEVRLGDTIVLLRPLWYGDTVGADLSENVTEWMLTVPRWWKTVNVPDGKSYPQQLVPGQSIWLKMMSRDGSPRADSTQLFLALVTEENTVTILPLSRE